MASILSEKTILKDRQEIKRFRSKYDIRIHLIHLTIRSFTMDRRGSVEFHSAQMVGNIYCFLKLLFKNFLNYLTHEIRLHRNSISGLSEYFPVQILEFEYFSKFGFYLYDFDRNYNRNRDIQ